jgi:serine/threonine protein kinase HipA of HipAB toxin-antitoxin module
VDPAELEVMESWYGVEDLIKKGAEEKFGLGTEKFLRMADEKVKYMKREMLRRYGVDGNHRIWD